MKNQYKQRTTYKGFTILDNLSRGYSIEGTDQKSKDINVLKRWIDREVVRREKIDVKLEQGDLFG